MNPIPITHLREIEFRRTEKAGRARAFIHFDTKLIVAARQFSATPVEGVGPICAYCCAPLKFDLGLEDVNGKRSQQPAELDHIISKTYTGADELDNFQYLCMYHNQHKLNYDGVLFHCVYHAAAMGEEIQDGHSFWSMYDVFMQTWKTESRLQSWIPYWMRNPRTMEPDLFGVDVKDKTIRLAEKKMREQAIFDRNTERCLAYLSKYNKPLMFKLEGILK